MRKEDYQKIITDLEIHYQEFLRNSQGSEMFGDEDKRKMQTQFTDAQKHYQTLIIQLPNQPRQPQPGLLSSWLLQSLDCWGLCVPEVVGGAFFLCENVLFNIWTVLQSPNIIKLAMRRGRFCSSFLWWESGNSASKFMEFAGKMRGI